MGGGSRVHLVHRWSVDGEPEFGWVRIGHSASGAVVEAVRGLTALDDGRSPLLRRPAQRRLQGRAALRLDGPAGSTA